MSTSVELAKAALAKYETKLATLEARQTPRPGELASHIRIPAEYATILVLKDIVADLRAIVAS